MLLIVTEVVLLAMGVLLLASGSSEKNRFPRVANYTAGIILLILLIAVLYMWR